MLLSLLLLSVGQFETPTEFQNTNYRYPFLTLQAFQEFQVILDHSEQGDFAADPKRPGYDPKNPGNPGYGPTPEVCRAAGNVVEFSVPEGSAAPRYPVLYDPEIWIDFSVQFADVEGSRFHQLVALYVDAVKAVDEAKDSPAFIQAKADCGLIDANGKCCDKTGALEKCKDSTRTTDGCEMAGAIGSCKEGSHGC